MAALLWLAMGDTNWWFAHGFSARLLKLSALVGGGTAIYFAALWLMGFRPHQFSRRAA